MLSWSRLRTIILPESNNDFYALSVRAIGKNIDFTKLELLKIETTNTPLCKKVSLTYDTVNEGIRKGIILRLTSII